MKKILTIILTLILTVSCLCACTIVKKEVSTPEPSVADTTTDVKHLDSETLEEVENTFSDKEENDSLLISEETNVENKKEEITAENNETETTEEPIIEENNIYENKILFQIEMENGDIMTGELYPDVAPITVNNFVKLINENFYDGLIFHRVIPGFMIQGGGYDIDLNNKETETIQGEFSINGINNPLLHTRGVISMARTIVPDSASSQFFIMHEDNTYLDGQYAAFGKITSGLEIIDKIASVKTESITEGMDDVPVDPQIIKHISIIE